MIRKGILLSFLIWLSIITSGLAQGGKVLESLIFKSKLLNAEVKYSIYLPNGYETSQSRYPVVYLLHGRGDNETAWVKSGAVNTTLDKAIASGELPPLIVVMPDAGTTYYVNEYQGKLPYENMFIQEFIPAIDQKYRTKADKANRGISGLSMGGYGSLLYAMHHPHLFAACAALSAAVRTDEEIIALQDVEYEARFKQIVGPNQKGQSRLTPYYRQNSILDLVKTKPVADLKEVKYYIDCGDDDFLSLGNATLHIQMLKAGIPHEYRSRDGAHNWVYWRTGVLDGLKFISKSFTK